MNHRVDRPAYVVLLMALLTLSAAALSAAALRADDAPARTSFGQFEFAIPAEWKSVQPDREKTAAMLLLNGKTWITADAMIMIDVGKPAAPTPEALAKSLAGKDGKVLPDPVSVDGTNGVKVETPSTDLSRPKCAVIVFHDSKVYLIMAAEKKGEHASDALDKIVQSWKWTPAK